MTLDDITYTKETYKDFKSIKDATVNICPQCGEGVKADQMKCPACGYCVRCDL